MESAASSIQHRPRSCPISQLPSAICLISDLQFPPLRLRASAVPSHRSLLGVDQSGVALRFPPHSKATGDFDAVGAVTLPEFPFFLLPFALAGLPPATASSSNFHPSRVSGILRRPFLVPR